MAQREPRGIRNNNAGNIRHGSDWQGMKPVQTDKNFVQFVTPEWGIRALYKVLLTYRNRYGLKSVSEIIARWAPPVENNTAAYVQSVSKELEVRPTDELSDEHYHALIAAIIKHENGKQPYSDELIRHGMNLA